MTQASCSNKNVERPFRVYLLVIINFTLVAFFLNSIINRNKPVFETVRESSNWELGILILFLFIILNILQALLLYIGWRPIRIFSIFTTLPETGLSIFLIISVNLNNTGLILPIVLNSCILVIKSIIILSLFDPTLNDFFNHSNPRLFFSRNGNRLEYVNDKPNHLYSIIKILFSLQIVDIILLLTYYLSSSIYNYLIILIIPSAIINLIIITHTYPIIKKERHRIIKNRMDNISTIGVFLIINSICTLLYLTINFNDYELLQNSFLMITITPTVYSIIYIDYSIQNRGFPLILLVSIAASVILLFIYYSAYHFLLNLLLLSILLCINIILMIFTVNLMGAIIHSMIADSSLLDNTKKKDSASINRNENTGSLIGPLFFISLMVMAQIGYSIAIVSDEEESCTLSTSRLLIRETSLTYIQMSYYQLDEGSLNNITDDTFKFNIIINDTITSAFNYNFSYNKYNNRLGLNIYNIIRKEVSHDFSDNSPLSIIITMVINSSDPRLSSLIFFSNDNTICVNVTYNKESLVLTTDIKDHDSVNIIDSYRTDLVLVDHLSITFSRPLNCN